ncbi:hypothetical protein [Streptomyces sp. GbtcB6]|uniref:hypothetical protein n=1 Tax=Streptomyces sp. GbtcB6 TaxID=2824751 RepID=UPI001C2F3814|nr:hypothetical protein [Streptomyces sp. GbtcB6]
MDAGTAAVLGALAGSLATIGAALATGWAQREGARIAARAEHRRERREPRLAAYKEFISVASEFREQSTFLAVSDFILEELDEARADSLFQASRAIKNSALEASLAGPQRVSKEVIKIQRLSGELSSNASLLKHTMDNPETVNQRLQRRFLKQTVTTARELNRAIDNFVLRAQAALDDDGSAS